ncbi:MAG TPA: hypothetical protein VGZ00_06435 [Candidatus Baltobacteraceae bacterium]|jgi:hypothetical protein|nr:hypothetical protein [Candidatus Baltobacteraceae bacterium]
MTILPTELIQAVDGAREHLGDSARNIAEANLAPGSPLARQALADAAHAAIFADAVSSALRSRLEELRTVSK